MSSERPAGQAGLFPFSDRGLRMLSRVRQFMRERVLPREAEFQAQIEAGPNPWTTPPVLDELKRQAKAWAKMGSSLICGDCDEAMVGEEA